MAGGKTKGPMEKFKNKYRIPSARALWWNYADKGLYFITICTAGHKYLFGNINNNEMILSDIGVIVQQEWEKSFEIRKELFCDAFVIMPNHIHGIVRIDKTNHDGAIPPVETHGRASLQRQSTNKPQNHGIAYRFPKSISSFVAGFKSSATKRINEYRNIPKLSVWQTRFHDHIIRNDDDYIHIKRYVETNAINWGNDKFFKES